MKIDEINHCSEFVSDWKKELDQCSDLEALRELCVQWGALVADAKTIVDGFDEQQFANFRQALETERRGQFSGPASAKDGFLTILMPGILFKVSITADQYQVPWGLAFIQMRKAGILKGMEAA